MKKLVNCTLKIVIKFSNYDIGLQGLLQTMGKWTLSVFWYLRNTQYWPLCCLRNWCIGLYINCLCTDPILYRMERYTKPYLPKYHAVPIFLEHHRILVLTFGGLSKNFVSKKNLFVIHKGLNFSENCTLLSCQPN